VKDSVANLPLALGWCALVLGGIRLYFLLTTSVNVLTFLSLLRLSIGFLWKVWILFVI